MLQLFPPRNQLPPDLFSNDSLWIRNGGRAWQGCSPQGVDWDHSVALSGWLCWSRECKMALHTGLCALAEMARGLGSARTVHGRFWYGLSQHGSVRVVRPPPWQLASPQSMCPQRQAEAASPLGLLWSSLLPYSTGYNWVKGQPDSGGGKLDATSPWPGGKVTLQKTRWEVMLWPSLENDLCPKSKESTLNTPEFKFSLFPFLMAQLLESYTVSQSLFTALQNEIYKTLPLMVRWN